MCVGFLRREVATLVAFRSPFLGRPAFSGKTLTICKHSRFLVVSCCALIALLAPAASSSAPHPLLTAVEQPYAPSEDLPAANQRIASGAKYTRIILYWRTSAARQSSPTNPNDPAYQWTDSVRTCASTARSPPGYPARHGVAGAELGRDRTLRRRGGDDRSQPVSFRRLRQAIAKRYPQVHYWEAWN